MTLWTLVSDITGETVLYLIETNDNILALHRCSKEPLRGS